MNVHLFRIDQLLDNGKTFFDLGEFSKAKSVYQEVVEQYPHDYRGWWELFKTQVSPMLDSPYGRVELKLLIGNPVKTAIKLFPPLTEEYYGIVQEIINKDMLRGSSWCPWATDNVSWSDVDVLSERNPLRIVYQKGKPYALRLDRLLSEAHHKFDRSDHWKSTVKHNIGVDVLYLSHIRAIIGNRLFYETNEDVNEYRAGSVQISVAPDEIINNLESAMKMIQNWKDNGKCPHCGGEYPFFKSWNRACKRCHQLWQEG